MAGWGGWETPGRRSLAPARHVPRAMLCAAALGAWAAGSAGAPAPSLRTPPLACSPADHMQTQIAHLHPPPPVKSIIRRRSPARGLLFLGRERERGDGERGEGGAGGGIAFDSCYFSDWRGLAGKGTWYKGCAQQGCVRARACAMPQLPAPRRHASSAMSWQSSGWRGFSGASQAPVLLPLPCLRRPWHVGSRVCKPQRCRSVSCLAPVAFARGLSPPV